ncbi:hypothetical protein PHPALM_31407 [Phytophthora palmivora]|uniref:Uncharacterized protein n=1 Tax=Phytophthora palmivora TaxID=4796 RepID=A0A2P4X2P8_9STRA|nr:hypothetical protein PHPALM_31407 [Phytophthora palmivora]
MLAAVVKSAIPEDINPKIAEIQSRVNELVRRYDDAVAAVDYEEFEEDDDGTVGGKRARTPARWKVGDFGDDPEVSAAIGSEAQKVGYAFEEATEQAVRRHQRLSHIHQVLQSVATNGCSLDDSEEEDNGDKPVSPALREHQLRSTIDALHREKDAITAQLQEALRMQQESRVANEQQAQELTKAQRALRAQAEELRLTHENNEKAAEAANALMISWRDKFQASSKAAAVAEAKVLELEVKVRVQSEEIMKHTFVLQTKMQEMERFKESEAARSRAEATAHAAALAEAEAETRRVKAKALEVKRKTKINIDGSNKELHELEVKVRELEGTLLAVENAKQELEAENTELSRRLREVQARFGEQRRIRYSVREDDSKQSETTSAPVSTFALRLRENEPRVNARKRQRGGYMTQTNAQSSHVAPVTPTAPDDEDNLSSSESEAGDSDNDEEIDEVEQDERELNRVMLQVVTTVFPVLLPAETDAALDESIARFEDPTRSPLNAIQPSTVVVTSVASDRDMVSRSELDALRNMYNRELDALKQQYVDGLQEYKSLVLEQPNFMLSLDDVADV